MTLNAQWIHAWINDAADAIHEQHDYLVKLDRAIGDGDHGENMDRGFAAVRTALDGSDAGPADLLKTVAKTLMSTVGGAAGPLYGTAFLRAAKAVPGDELDADAVANLIAAGLEGIQARGKAEEGEKTMVDAWAPAARAAREAADAGKDAAEALQAAAAAAQEGAQNTLEMKATKGRASYLGERSVGHLDPGACSSNIIWESAAKAATA